MDRANVWVGPIVGSIEQYTVFSDKAEPVFSDKAEPIEEATLEAHKITAVEAENIILDGDVQQKLEEVHFVIVFLKDNVKEGNNYLKIESFVLNLEDKGFLIDEVSFTGDDNVHFIKIFAPKDVLLRYADIFSIELSFQTIISFKTKILAPSKCMETPLSSEEKRGEIFQRTRRNLPWVLPKDVTSAERGLIIYKVLEKNPYGKLQSEYGIEALLHQTIVECAYPLHDGPYEWPELGPINDRQLLARYWSPIKYWYKLQPLDLIEKYYGPELAFYFAWLQFYNKMLIPAAVAGLLCFVLGVVYCFSGANLNRSEEVCKSDIILCPRCIQVNCRYSLLRKSCLYSRLTSVFDNPLTVAFAAILSIWATVFLQLWQRRECSLRIRWNLQSIETDFSMRPGYEEQTKHKRKSPITGVEEPYVPKKTRCFHHAITTAIIAFLVFLMLLGILGVIVYRIAITAILMKTKEGRNLILLVSASGSLISVCFILAFEFFYQRIAFYMTNLENPRTQVEFNNSLTYKCYAIAFVNNYAVVFYIAFFKGHFFTHPGDRQMWDFLGGIASDMCDYGGCVFDLTMQIFIQLLAKSIFFTITQYVLPKIFMYIRRRRRAKKGKGEELKTLEQYEQDYLLNPYGEHQLLDEYMQMIIRYGFVTFFVASCPLTPLMALVNNLFESRVDASKLTTAYMRPVAHKIATIGAWNEILQLTTYIGIATNAFVIAFTSEFVQRESYRLTVNSNLIGYVNYTLSVFNISDYERQFSTSVDAGFCYYVGMRNPPDHPKKYGLADIHWFILAIKLFFVVIFEHSLALFTGFLAYVIPDVPFTVKEQIQYQKVQIKNIRTRALNEKYLREKKRRMKDTIKDTIKDKINDKM